MSTATIIPIYYMIDISVVQPAPFVWIPSITNYNFRILPITNPILLTYKQLYDLTRNDIKTDIINNFIKYLNVKVIFGRFLYGDMSGIIDNGNIERLNFDIDVTKPFKLSQLVENVI